MLGGETLESNWQGEFIVISDGKEEVIKNRITNIGLNLLRDFLNGDVSDGEIKYLALGTGSTAISDTSTQLEYEFFRTAFISTTKPDIGILEKTAFILDIEAVGNIQELGIFAGSTASTATNSGILISRVLYSRNKTNLESIQFVRRDNISRG